MNWLPVIALLLGFVVFYFVPLQLPSDYAPYLSLATLSGLDSILGGIRAGIEGKFHVDVFISGFIFNTLLAALLAYLGDQIGVDLFLAAVVTLGGRMFLNLSLIRRYYLTQWSISRQRDTERT
ncbi:MAG: hypothetical protein KatS3mg023_1301 [Armatimonadota bacterium]|nr:MAG: hypothetical protein KatS3mg023_1301 [Armatimonadota bacterium]